MRSLFAVIALFLGLSLPALADQPGEDAAKLAVAEFYKGHAALQQNDAQEAIDHFSKSLQIGSLDQTQVAYVHHYRAIAYQRLNKQQEAIDDYTQALATGALPQRVQAAIYYNRAIALDHLANFDRAIKDYSQAVNLKPDYAEAYMNRGNAYRKLGDNDNALKDYEKSAALGNPIKQLPYYGEGLVLEAKGDKQGALRAFKTALNLAPDFEPAKLKVDGYQAAGLKLDTDTPTVVASAKPATPPSPPPSVGTPAPTVVVSNMSSKNPNAPQPPKPVPAPQQVASTAPSQTAKPADIKPATLAPSPMVIASATLPKAPSAPKPTGVGATASIAPQPSALAMNQGTGTTGSTPARTAPLSAPNGFAAARTPKATPPSASMAPNETASTLIPVTNTGAKPAEPSTPGDIELADAAVPAVGTAPPQQVASIPKPAPETSARGSDGFHVQVGSYASEDQANSQANTIIGRQASLLSGLDQDIQRADLGSKGIYYRLRFGPFASRDDAASKCSALKSAGQDCIVVR